MKTTATGTIMCEASMPLYIGDQKLAATLDQIPSETTQRERRFLYHFFSKIWGGKSHVCEIGPFLGGTTRAIALGMLANPNLRADHKLFTYDRFTDYYDPQALKTFLRPLFEAGILENHTQQLNQKLPRFKDIFTEIHYRTDYASLIVAYESVLPDTPRTLSLNSDLFKVDEGIEFDAVFVDGCKSWYGTKYFMIEMSRHVQPGAYFLFQDYGWYTCFWIPAFLYVMRDRFRLIFYTDNTYVFQLIAPLNGDWIESHYPDGPHAFEKGFFDSLFNSLLAESLVRHDDYALIFHTLQHAAALAYTGHVDDARAKILNLATQPYAQDYQSLIQQALKSPTYTPDGPIYLTAELAQDGANKRSPSGSRTSGSRSTNIRGLRPSVFGIYMVLDCLHCNHTFERYQPTIAGVAIGQHVCPQCGTASDVWPEDFEAALERHLPVRSTAEMVHLTEEASRIAKTWYTVEPLAQLLTERGINMGEPGERELLSFISLGLYAPSPQERGSV